jgi:hypothetical protein
VRWVGMAGTFGVEQRADQQHLKQPCGSPTPPCARCLHTHVAAALARPRWAGLTPGWRQTQSGCSHQAVAAGHRCHCHHHQQRVALAGCQGCC